MSMLKINKYVKKVFSMVLCFVLAVTISNLAIPQTAPLAQAGTISSLITSYKPQVQISEVNTILHPGGAMNASYLDNMRDHVRAGDEPWNTAFTAFSSDSFCSTAPRIYYEAGNEIFVNICGPWAYTNAAGVYYSNPSAYVGDRANKDGATAFKQAIMWYITGNDTYRANAMTIIRDYAAIQSCAVHRNFRYGTLTFWLASAAEILRYSDCQTASLQWTSADTANLTNMMTILTNAYNLYIFHESTSVLCNGRNGKGYLYQ